MQMKDLEKWEESEYYDVEAQENKRCEWSVVSIAAERYFMLCVFPVFVSCCLKLFHSPCAVLCAAFSISE